MVDVTAGQGVGATNAGFPTLTEIGNILKRGDIALALGVLTILVVLILPLPAIVLDLFLAISITLSILILMTSLFIQAPLEFSAFPTVLLISTMLRLSLNMASTRLILSHGHEGTDAAGHVIEAFGSFVMGGNFVIGIIVFAILIIVNFVVITKGSGRIAEVAARFHLDAMPGKQMAIDADLSAGLIDEKVAKQRRKDLEDESGFFGAMDGASKFVRGDAIAGLLIVFINIVGGMIIGVAQQGLSFADAGRSYTLLTVGDGLVTQVPALIVSTAAGLLVSKAGVSGAADKALMKQFSGYPQALAMSAAVMLVLAALPGIPTIPFLALGAGAGALAWHARNRNRVTARAEEAARTAPAPGTPGAPGAAAAEEPISAALKIDDLKIELGYALLPLVNGPDGTDRLTEQIKALRRSLAIEMGFVMPAVRILDNVQLEANTYIIKIKEVDAGTGKIWPNQFMVMDPGGSQVQVPGHPHHRADLRPARNLGRCQPQGRSLAQGLHRRRRRDRALDPPHRAAQGQHVGLALLWRGAEAAEGAAEGAERAGQGHRAGPGHGLRHPARAAAAARRAHLDPRSLDHPGRHRRLARLLAQSRDHGRACPRPPRAADLRAKHLLQRLSAADRAVGAVGTGLRRIHHRARRGTQPRDAALEAVGIHDRRARGLRARRARRRGAGAGHVCGNSSLRTLSRRAVPGPDDGAVAG
ncbi:hypothetical protein ABIF44_007430 [Bradyrhizobium japonicum]